MYDEEKDNVNDDVEAKARPTNNGVSIRWMYKNVIGVGLSVLFVFSAFQGLQNLQSSLCPLVGLVSLAIVYVFFALSCFITPGLIKLVGTKYTLLVGFICHFFYSMAYFYPSWYTLVPASLLLGLASGPIWASANAHLVNVAVASAPSLGQDQDHLISVSVGIFFFFFQWSQIPGNLASSLIFFPYSSSNVSLFNEDANDFANYSSNLDSCGRTESNRIDARYLYILVSVYLVFISLGIASLLCMVDHRPGHKELSSGVLESMKLYFKDPVVELFKVIKDWRMVFVTPLSIFNGLEQSFVFGTFTEIIAEHFGPYLVGFSIIVFGVTSALLSIAYGRLVKYIRQYTIVLFGGAINVGSLLFLVLWVPTPSYAAIFVFVICWGAADAAWNTMITSIVGILFVTQSEVAYSVQRMWMAVGLTFGFVSTIFLSRRARYFIMLAAIVIALLSYLLLKLTTRLRERSLIMPCCHSDSSTYSTHSCKNDLKSQKDCDNAQHK